MQIKKPIFKNLLRIELGILILSLLVTAFTVLISFNTQTLSTQSHIHSLTENIIVKFSHPISRLIVSVHTYPKSHIQIDWDRPSFRDSLYRDLVLEPQSPLLPDQTYYVDISGVKTVDRLRKIPLSFTLETPPFPDISDKIPKGYCLTDQSLQHTKCNPNTKPSPNQNLIYIKNFPDFKRKI